MSFQNLGKLVIIVQWETLVGYDIVSLQHGKETIARKSVYSLGFQALPVCHTDKSRTRMKLRLRHW